MRASKPQGFPARRGKTSGDSGMLDAGNRYKLQRVGDCGDSEKKILAIL